MAKLGGFSKLTQKGLGAASKTASAISNNNMENKDNTSSSVGSLGKTVGSIFGTIFVSIFTQAIAIFIVATILIGTIWVAFTYESEPYEPQYKFYEKYLYKSNKIEGECFTKSYEYVINQAVASVSESVKGLDGNAQLKESANEIFGKDKDGDYKLYTYLGMATAETEEIVEKGVSSQITHMTTAKKEDDIQKRILTIREDSKLTAFSEHRVKTATATSLDWVERAHFLYFPTVGSDLSFIGNKVLYNINYNNSRFTDNAYSFAVFETLFTQTYECDKYEYYRVLGEEIIADCNAILTEINSPTAHQNNGYYKFDDNNPSGNSTGIAYANQIVQKYGTVVTKFNNAKHDQYYFDAEVENTLRDLRNQIKQYFPFVFKENEDKYKNIRDSYEIANISEIQNEVYYNNHKGINDKTWIEIRETERENKMYEFFKSEKFYKNILTYSVSINKHNNGQFELDDLMTFNSLNTVDVNITINVAPAEKILEIYGIIDSSGNINKTYEKWILGSNKLSEQLQSDSEIDLDSLVNGNTTDITDNENANNNSSNNNNATVPKTSKYMYPFYVGEAYSLEQYITSRVNESRYIFGQLDTGHKGTDFGLAEGTPIVSSTDGVVIYSSGSTEAAYGSGYGGYGICVAIYNKELKQTFLYAHLSKAFVNKGQTVTQGQHIGNSGNTGQSTGPHLHFEVRQMSGGYNSSIASYLDGYALLTGADATGYLLNGSLASSKAEISTIYDFIESAKDSSKATLEAVTEAGYPASSIYWQYRIKCYYIFISRFKPVEAFSEFFCDTSNILTNDDGNYRIDGPYFRADDYINTNVSGVDATVLPYEGYNGQNTAFWVVHCKPNTVVYAPNPCNVFMLHQSSSPVNEAFPSELYGKESFDSDAYREGRLESLPNATASITYPKTNDKSRYITYAYTELDTMFCYEICNLSIDTIATNGETQTLRTVGGLGSKYTDDYAAYTYDSDLSKYQTSNKYHKNDIRAFYETDASNANDTNSFVFDGYKSNHGTTGSTILGTTISSDMVANGSSLGEKLEHTFVFGINLEAAAVINDANRIEKFSVKDASQIDIYDWFDLNYVDRSLYNASTGATWPLVGSYEVENHLNTTVSGKVVASTNNSVVIESDTGVCYKITSSVSNLNSFTVGTEITDATNLSELSGENISVNVVKKSGSQWVVEKNLATATTTIPTMRIKFRNDIFYKEDSGGLMAKVVAMYPGKIIESNASKIKVYCDELDCYYEYSLSSGISGAGLEPILKVGDVINSGGAIAYVRYNSVCLPSGTTIDDSASLNVRVYQINTRTEKMHSDTNCYLESPLYGKITNISHSSITIQNSTGVNYQFGNVNITDKVYDRYQKAKKEGKDAYVNNKEAFAKTSAPNTQVQYIVSSDVASNQYMNPMDLFKDLEVVNQANSRIYIQTEDESTGRMVTAKNLILNPGESIKVIVKTYPISTETTGLSAEKGVVTVTPLGEVEGYKSYTIKAGNKGGYDKVSSSVVKGSGVGMTANCNIQVTSDPIDVLLYRDSDSGDLLNNTLMDVKYGSDVNIDFNAKLKNSTYTDVEWAIDSKIYKVDADGEETTTSKNSSNYLKINKQTGIVTSKKTYDGKYLGMTASEYAKIRVSPTGGSADAKAMSAVVKVRLVKPVTNIEKEVNGKITFYTSKTGVKITDIKTSKGDRINIKDFVKVSPNDATYKNEISVTSKSKTLEINDGLVIAKESGIGESGQITVKLNTKGAKYSNCASKELVFEYEIKGNDISVSNVNIPVYLYQELNLKDYVKVNNKLLKDYTKAEYDKLDIRYVFVSGDGVTVNETTGAVKLTKNGFATAKVQVEFGVGGCDGVSHIKFYDYSPKLVYREIKDEELKGSETSWLPDNGADIKEISLDKVYYMRFEPVSGYSEYVYKDNDTVTTAVKLSDYKVFAVSMLNEETSKKYDFNYKFAPTKEGDVDVIITFTIPSSDVNKYKLSRNTLDITYKFKIKK